MPLGISDRNSVTTFLISWSSGIDVFFTAAIQTIVFYLNFAPTIQTKDKIHQLHYVDNNNQHVVLIFGDD